MLKSCLCTQSKNNMGHGPQNPAEVIDLEGNEWKWNIYYHFIFLFLFFSIPLAFRIKD